jgi:hypothetical protein
MHHGNSIRY